MQFLTANVVPHLTSHEVRCNQCGEIMQTTEEEVMHRCVTCGNTRFYMLDLRTPFDSF